MVDAKSVDDQLKRIKFNTRNWNRAEAIELAAILLPEEQIFECVNGWYEGGFALLCATDIRILLVDKKPLKFLTVEDLRFDMINQIDYSHRMMDARISVSAGMKSLKFRSYNQQRLRKLIGHVQHRMAEIKTEQSTNPQKEHLKQIDQQLQTYLLAQYQQHESMRRQLAGTMLPAAEPQQPQSLSANYDLSMIDGSANEPQSNETLDAKPAQMANISPTMLQPTTPSFTHAGVSSDELYEEGIREIYGKQLPATEAVQYVSPAQKPTTMATTGYPSTSSTSANPLEINPLRIAYSKLPMVLRNRQYGRTSLQRSANQADYAAPTV